MNKGCTVTTFALLAGVLILGFFAAFTDDGRLLDLDACNNIDADNSAYFNENEFECETVDLIVWLLLPAWGIVFVVWLITRFLPSRLVKSSIF